MCAADSASSTDSRVFPPSADFAANAHISSMAQYKEMYKRSIEDPEGFWGELAEGFYWKEKWSKVRECDFKGDINIKWFIGAKTNITYNCLDRHLDQRGDQVAIIWEGNEPGEDAKLRNQNYQESLAWYAAITKEMFAT